MEIANVVKELAKISRDRQIVKGAIISDDAKLKLLASLDERASALAAQMSAPVALSGAKKPG